MQVIFGTLDDAGDTQVKQLPNGIKSYRGVLTGVGTVTATVDAIGISGGVETIIGQLSLSGSGQSVNLITDGSDYDTYLFRVNTITGTSASIILSVEITNKNTVFIGAEDGQPDFSGGAALLNVNNVNENSSEKAYTRILAQGSSIAVASPALTYTVDLTRIDLSTAYLVLITTAGSVTVNGQVSFDGLTNKAPSTPFTIFSSVSSGTNILKLDGVTNFAYGHYMTGDINVATATTDIELFLMAQGK